MMARRSDPQLTRVGTFCSSYGGAGATYGDDRTRMLLAPMTTHAIYSGMFVTYQLW